MSGRKEGRGARGLLANVGTVSSLTLISRVLGFVRDVLMASHLGAGAAADAFFVAFKLPNFFRRLFAEGAFSAGFVPLFAKALEKDPSGQAARRFAEEALAFLLAALLLFTALVEFAMPWAMLLLAPGFRSEPDKFALAVDLTRLTFPYLALVSMVALLAGILNGCRRFAAAAAAPILLNLTLIGALVLVTGTPMRTAHALAIAVSIAGIIQFVWLLRASVQAGIRLRLRWPHLTPGVRRLIRLMAPVALAAGVTQLNLMLDIILASFLPDGSLSFLFYADRLNQLPLGVIGVAVGTALLPALSRALAAGDAAAAERQQIQALSIVMGLALPAAGGLMALSDLLIAGLFQRGAFDAADSRATAAALVAYAAGLPAYMLTKALLPAFFAREDTATPTRYAMIALTANAALNLVLIWPLAHVGLALATALAAWLQTGLLYRRLRAIDQLPAGVWHQGVPLARMLTASALMVAGLLVSRDLFGSALVEAIGRTGAVLTMVALGLALYAFSLALVGLGRFLDPRALSGRERT